LRIAVSRCQRASRLPAQIGDRFLLADARNRGRDCNAVYHATDKRIRQLPIRIENLLEA
jgi:hypothetical protein